MMYTEESTIGMDLTIISKVIKIEDRKLHFGYNTQMDYLYFDLYHRDGRPIRYHNKVVANLDFGKFFFTSEEPDTGRVCTAKNIEDWQIVVKVR